MDNKVSVKKRILQIKKFITELQYNHTGKRSVLIILSLLRNTELHLARKLFLSS